MEPVRLQLSRARGSRLQASSPNGLPVVKVDRTTKWGNPFKLGATNPTGSVTQANRHAWQLYLGFAPQNELLCATARAELRGRNLACWCKLPEPYQDDTCHAAVLLKIANSEPGEIEVEALNA